MGHAAHMNTTTKKWGVRGAIAAPVLGGLLMLTEMGLAYDSPLKPPLHYAVWSVISYPVLLAWQPVLRSFHGDQGMILILPVLATVLVYLACLGFCIGVLLKKTFRIP